MTILHMVAGLLALNTILLSMVGWLIKHELHDIKKRIVRMENIYFQQGR